MKVLNIESRVGPIAVGPAQAVSGSGIGAATETAMKENMQVVSVEVA